MSARVFLIRTLDAIGERGAASEQARILASKTPAQPNQEFRPIYVVSAEYPKRAVQRRLPGEVVVEFTIDENGNTRDCKVIESTHRMFNQSALEAIRKKRYLPRFVDGVPVVAEHVRDTITYATD
jgi:protein TonB